MVINLYLMKTDAECEESGEHYQLINDKVIFLNKNKV